MKPFKRIRQFIENVDVDKALTFIDIKQYLDVSVINQIKNELEQIEEAWSQDPDLRFTQCLVNMNYIPNLPGAWYYIEDNEILIDQGFEPNDVLYWGTFGKNQEYKYPKYIKIKDLETSHINIILDTQKNMNVYMRKIMEDEVNKRK